MSEHRLSILHISDLHARSLDVDELPEPARNRRRRQVHAEAASRARVLGTAWADNLRTLYPNGERPDLVCFTGDVADWGLAAEYAKATELVDELVGVLGIARSQVYVVPGNHDVQRYTSEAEWAVMRELLRTDTRATADWLAGLGDPPRAVEAGVADAVMRRTAAFWRWVEHGLGRPELLPARHPHRRLGYHHVPALPQLPFAVHVIGLDSAWLAGDDHDQGKLWLTERQRDMLLHDEHGQPWTGFRLALVHHPLEELAQPDIGPARRGLARSADLLLHGHQHDPVGSNLVDLDGDALRVLAAGCLYEGAAGSEWKNGCQRIDVVLDDAGRPLRAEIWFRAWSSRGHWHSDSSLYRGLTDGRMVWDAWDGGQGGALDTAPSGRLNAREAQPGHARTVASTTTQPEPQPSQAIDNRGASVAQQINVYGNVTVGATTISPLEVGGSRPGTEGDPASLAATTIAQSSEEKTEKAIGIDRNLDDRGRPVTRRFVLPLALFVVAMLSARILYDFIAARSKDCIPITNTTCMDSLEVSRAEFNEFLLARCSVSESDPRICTASQHLDPENHESLYSRNEAARLEQNAQCTDDRWASDHPIICVEWHQANAYCEWVGGRLPSIEEWSIAVGTSTYPWGDEPPTLARVNGCGSECSKVELKGFPDRKRTPFPGDEEHVATAPVGSYPPTGAGFYDLAGNVWEWTSTPGQPRYSFPASLRDAGHLDAAYLVVGGGWDTDQDRAHDFEANGRRAIPRFAIRRDNNLGFRCVRPLSTVE